jgi:metallo-beta-lactamase class B
MRRSQIETKKITRYRSVLSPLLVCAFAMGPGGTLSSGQSNLPDHPVVTVEGRDYTPKSIFVRNTGSSEDQATQFPPHKIIDNIYYVGTKTLSSFLIVTPAGNILINSTYERNATTIRKSVEQLGFKFSDIKILLGNHAHGDHMEGDAMVKELTGAQVIVMAEDVPALKKMTTGAKDRPTEHPIDKIIHDGDEVTLGGVILTAHLTAGHTRGATAWTMKANEGGKTYDVVFFSSLRPPVKLTPPVIEEFKRSFKIVDSLPCDVPLGDHPEEFNMWAKYAKLQPGRPNPYVDLPGCKLESKIEESMFNAVIKEQEANAASPN